VIDVESRGGFLPDKRPKILFERHYFSRLTKGKFDAAHPDISNPKWGGYGAGGANQYDRLGRAIALNRDAALQSASWGLFQIMGYHWKTLGYPTLQAFINAMYYSEGDQLDAFVRFVKANPKLHEALKRQDWRAFSLLYNGPEYERNSYHTKLEAAFKSAGGGIA